MKHQRFILFSILATTLVICSVPASAEMTVRVIDVGLGDAVLISSDDQHLLFDAGPALAHVPLKLKWYGITSLDYFITSHPDADHIGGAAKVIHTLPIGVYADSGATHTTATYENMLQALSNTNTSYVELGEGDSFTLGDVKIDVLFADARGGSNAGSLVLKLTDGDVTMILPGDHEDLDNWSADILMVPHHGSAGSSIELVKPEITIISVGAGNRYGYPTKSTLDKIAAVEAEMYRTDLEGDITVLSDGTQYTVSSHKNTPSITPPVALTKLSTLIKAETPEPIKTLVPTLAPTPIPQQTSSYVQPKLKLPLSSSAPCSCSRGF